MKKKPVIISLTFVAAVMSISCNPDPKKEATEKEIIVVPTKTVILEKEPEKKSTTITLDKNGVKVEAKKLDVSIKN